MSVGVVCLLAFATAHAADEPRVAISVRAPHPGPSADFRAGANLVLVPVTVTDSANRAITGLTRDAFRIFDGKTPQTLLQFAREDVPLSIGIVFDLSGSMRDKLPQARAAVDQFLHDANPEDEFLLVEFTTRASITVPFTTNTAEIRDRLRRAVPGGKTALIDAVHLAIDSMRGASHARRALLIISDGADNDSRSTRTDLLNRVRESDLAVYAIGIYDLAVQSLPEEAGAGQDFMASVAAGSGGRHFAVNRLAELPDVAARIALELRNQYVLGYSPGDSLRDGKFHRVQVKVIEGRHLTVSWRPGYYAMVE